MNKPTLTKEGDGIIILTNPHLTLCKYEVGAILANINKIRDFISTGEGTTWLRQSDEWYDDGTNKLLITYAPPLTMSQCKAIDILYEDILDLNIIQIKDIKL